MLIELTEGEIIVIRDALREWRTVTPAHVASDEQRLMRWREYRELFNDARESADTKMTCALSSLCDAEAIERKSSV